MATLLQIKHEAERVRSQARSAASSTDDPEVERLARATAALADAVAELAKKVRALD